MMEKFRNVRDRGEKSWGKVFRRGGATVGSEKKEELVLAEGEHCGYHLHWSM